MKIKEYIQSSTKLRSLFEALSIPFLSGLQPMRSRDTRVHHLPLPDHQENLQLPAKNQSLPFHAHPIQWPTELQPPLFSPQIQYMPHPKPYPSNLSQCLCHACALPQLAVPGSLQVSDQKTTWECCH